MRNSVKRLLALVLTCAMLSVCVFAADFTGCADELYELGLFKGTGTDADGNPVYSLDKAPTRAEAITMLVRLLGKETEALEGEWEVPFTDLDGANVWALPYVGYAYENGLTNGETEAVFGTNNACSAQMYCTLVLRSLGYSDAAEGDFEYAKAVEFATEKGLLDAYISEGTFLRDEVAAVSYAALLTTLNDSETLLLDKLVEDGAVTAENAKVLTDKAALFAEFNALSAKVNAEQDASVDMSLDVNILMSSAGIQVPMTIVGSEKVCILKDGVQMATLMTTTVMGEAQVIETYVKDGVMYTNDGTSKTKAAYTEVDDILSSLDLNSATSSPLYFLDSISKTEADGKVSYTITLSGSLLTSMTTSLLGSMEQDLGSDEITFGAASITMTYKGDALSSAALSIPVTIVSEGQTIDLDMDLELTVNKTGADVVIEFPTDLDTYVEAATDAE